MAHWDLEVGSLAVAVVGCSGHDTAVGAGRGGAAVEDMGRIHGCLAEELAHRYESKSVQSCISSGGRRLTSTRIDLAGYWRHMLHTAHQLARAGNLHAVAGHMSSLFEAVRSLLEHHRTGELVADNLAAAGHIAAIDRMADSPAEERSSLADTGCRGQT